MPISIRRHHWSSASILHVSVLDITQQSEPYRNIGKMHVLYSFNFVEEHNATTVNLLAGM